MRELPAVMITNEVQPAVLGYLAGARCGTGVPTVVGLPRLDEDAFKVFGAAAGSSGGIGLCHAVGCPPEAPDLESVLPDPAGVQCVRRTRRDLVEARAELITPSGDSIDAVSIGTALLPVRVDATRPAVEWNTIGIDVMAPLRRM